MNKKGFTLVELIVAITILGIITGLAFSGVANIIENNRKTKFEEYGKSLMYSAKIYVDSYSEDMFYDGSSETNCHKLNLSTLINQNKVKDFTQNDITCNNSDSAIYIYKVNGDNANFSYSVELKCTKESDGSEMFNNTTTTANDDVLKQFDKASCGSSIAEDQLF